LANRPLLTILCSLLILCLLPVMPAAAQSDPPAQCPAIDPTRKYALPDEKALEKVSDVGGGLDLHSYLLEAINQGVSLAAFTAAFKPYTLPPAPPIRFPRFYAKPDAITTRDLTGDSVPEIIYNNDRRLDIYTCQEGQYRAVFDWASPYPANNIGTFWLRDLNRDGLPELVFQDFDVAPVAYGTATFIYGWRDGHFQNLLRQEAQEDRTDPAYDNAYYSGPSQTTAQDVDGDGRQEIVLREFVGNWDVLSWGPWRNHYITFKWDGQQYGVLPLRYDPPIYRYQAVQDGDRAARRGEYTAALGLYRQAISDPALVWWSEARFQERRNDPAALHWSTKPLPTGLRADPNEYPNLVAYTHYRSLLVYAALGKFAYAQAEYQILQKSFPAGNPGSVFTHLAGLFWQAYPPAASLADGCRPVVAYVTQHPEIMDPIGASWHGWESLQYQPTDVCPTPAPPEPEPTVLHDLYAQSDAFADGYFPRFEIETVKDDTSEFIVQELVRRWLDHLVEGCADPYYKLQEYKLGPVKLEKGSQGYDIIASVQFSYLPLQPLTRYYPGNIAPNGWVSIPGNHDTDGWDETTAYFGVYKEGKFYRLRWLIGWGT
jgi:hypothetical protein